MYTSLFNLNLGLIQCNNELIINHWQYELTFSLTKILKTMHYHGAVMFVFSILNCVTFEANWIDFCIPFKKRKIWVKEVTSKLKIFFCNQFVSRPFLHIINTHKILKQIELLQEKSGMSHTSYWHWFLIHNAIYKQLEWVVSLETSC